MIGGQVVLHDIKDASADARYAIGDVITAAAEGDGGVLVSGVHLLERVDLPEDERQRLAAAKGPRDVLSPHEAMPSDLADWMATAPSNEVREVTIALRRPLDYVAPYERFERSVALGDVTTDTDADVVRELIAAKQRALVDRELATLVPTIESTGAIVVSRCRNTFCLSVLVAPPQLAALVSLQQVKRIDPLRAVENDAIRGREYIAGTQLEQFVTNGYDGFVSTGRVKAGILEHQRFSVTHVGYNADAVGTSRIVSKRECDSACADVANFGSAQSHPTVTTGLLAGSLMNGQDSAVTNYWDRMDRSGSSRHADIHMWRAPGDGDVDEALDDIAGFSIPVLSMSISIGGTYADPLCAGQTTASVLMNDLFDAGTVVFKSGGNNGHASTSDCTVEAPGNALGAFVIGMHGSANIAGGSEADVRSGPIFNASDRGGTPWEGSRSIIDLTSQPCRQFNYTVGGGYATTSSCSTSYATPAVAGAAVDFIDWYKTEISSAIDDPTSLTANMLLMGDREAESGGDLLSGFSNLWGAGRTKMRRFDTAGLDNPAQWGSLSTCIDHDEWYAYELNGGSVVSSDVDALKAITYFFDRRHEDGLMDDIDLYLQRSTNKTSWTTIRSSAAGLDEKERVYHDSFAGNYYWRLLIHGDYVTADQTSCGVNSMRVRFVWFFEDSDREPAENLDEIDPE